MDNNIENNDQTLACVRVVSRNGPEALRLPHVVKTLHEFLDYSSKVFLYRACRANFQHLVQQKLAIYAQEPADSWVLNPRFRQWQCADAMINSVDSGNLELVQMVSNHFSDCQVPIETYKQAAKLGRAEILKWLVLNRPDAEWDSTVVDFALVGNHLELAKWLKERVETTPTYAIGFWVSHAMKNGNVDMLKWVSSLSKNVQMFRVHMQRTVKEAVDNGHLEVVKWVLPQINVETRNFYFNLDKASSNGHFEVVEWLAQNYQKKCHIELADRKAARHGRLDIVRLFHTNNISGCSKSVIDSAAAGGHLDIVKWLQSYTHNRNKRNFEVSTSQAIDVAAENGHLEIVQWLHEHTDEGCSTSAMDGAARNNHFEIMRWLHEHRSEGCTGSAMNIAASNGNLHMVQWLSENRTEGCTTFAMDWAAWRGHLDVVKWLHENRQEGCTADAMDLAAKYGHLDVVKWLHETRSEGCTTEAMDGAAENGHLDVVQWLHENRSEGCTTKAMNGAAKNNFWDVIEWLDQNRPEGATAAGMTSIARRGDMNGIIKSFCIRSMPCNAIVVAEAVYNGHFELARFLHQERQRTECDVIPALRACTDENRRWEFVEWMHLNYRDEFEKMAEDIFAEP